MNSFLPPVQGAELLETCAVCSRLHAPRDLQATNPVCMVCDVALRHGPAPAAGRPWPPRPGLPRRRQA